MKRLALWIVGFAALCQAEPIEHGLEPVAAVAPPLLSEVRYATKHNFTGEVLYPIPAVWVHRDLIEPLTAVQAELAKAGLGLKIYDGYRPLSVQQKMWDLVRDERYVSNPAVNRGRHTRGTAVDVTLVDRMGNELEMPSRFDDFTEAAHRDSKTMTPKQRENMLMLQAVMAKHGFEPYPFEWWHFDFRDWKEYPVLDVSCEALARGEKTTEVVE